MFMGARKTDKHPTRQVFIVDSDHESYHAGESSMMEELMSVLENIEMFLGQQGVLFR